MRSNIYTVSRDSWELLLNWTITRRVKNNINDHIEPGFRCYSMEKTGVIKSRERGKKRKVISEGSIEETNAVRSGTSLNKDSGFEQIPCCHCRNTDPSIEEDRRVGSDEERAELLHLSLALSLAKIGREIGNDAAEDIIRIIKDERFNGQTFCKRFDSIEDCERTSERIIQQSYPGRDRKRR